jgi:molybdenum cofactor biosynthesis protein B
MSEAHPGSAQAIRALVITVSDSRGEKEDLSGPALKERLEAAGATVARVDRVKDERDEIARIVASAALSGDFDLIALTGGTGIAPRDVTYEAVEPLLEKRLDGFGEAFRRLSWEEVGARSVLSRAVAGTRGRVLIVALPGSTNAVKLAVDKVLTPVMGHAVKLLRG